MKSDYCWRIKSLFTRQSARLISSTINESKDAKGSAELHDCMMILKLMEGSTVYILEYQMSSLQWSCRYLVTKWTLLCDSYFSKNIFNELSPAKFKIWCAERSVMILSLLLKNVLFPWLFLSWLAEMYSDFCTKIKLLEAKIPNIVISLLYNFNK